MLESNLAIYYVAISNINQPMNHIYPVMIMVIEISWLCALPSRVNIKINMHACSSKLVSQELLGIELLPCTVNGQRFDGLNFHGF